MNFISGLIFGLLLVFHQVVSLQVHNEFRERITVIESEVCSQHEGFRHCENGETIEFNGGVK